MKLLIGPGNNLVEGWKSLDYSFGARVRKQKVKFDYEHNLMSLKPFPIEDNSVSMVYTEHCLEHMPSIAVLCVLIEVYRIMEVGATLRISVPDFDKLYEMYKDGSIVTLNKSYNDPLFALIAEIASPLASDYQKYKSCIENRNMDIFTCLTNSTTTEMQEKRPGGHLSWWTFEKMRDALEKTGFRCVEETDCGMSRRLSMRTPEFDTTHPDYSLYTESIK